MAHPPRGLLSLANLAALLTLLIVSFRLSLPIAAQDKATGTPDGAPCNEFGGNAPAEPQSALRHIDPGQTAAGAAVSGSAATAGLALSSAGSDCSGSASSPASATLQLSRYLPAAELFSSSSASSWQTPADGGVPSFKDTREANLYAIAHPTNGKYPVTLRTGKWGGEEWEPAILQTLGFTLAQNGYRLATEEKTRRALVKETWHSYWLAVSGLHTWSDGGKTWTVYVAHPAQGAVFNDIWLEHDPHAALVPFGFNKVYWGERIKSFWWDSVWELQWKFGPFSEASIGNVGLVPGKLGANTIVSSAFIGTGLSVGEDMLDRYGIAKWERHTNNRVLIAFMRGGLNPDRSFANLFRKKYPWYRDRRPRLLDREPALP